MSVRRQKPRATLPEGFALPCLCRRPERGGSRRPPQSRVSLLLTEGIGDRAVGGRRSTCLGIAKDSVVAVRNGRPGNGRRVVADIRVGKRNRSVSLDADNDVVGDLGVVHRYLGARVGFDAGKRVPGHDRAADDDVVPGGGRNSVFVGDRLDVFEHNGIRRVRRRRDARARIIQDDRVLDEELGPASGTVIGDAISLHPVDRHAFDVNGRRRGDGDAGAGVRKYCPTANEHGDAVRTVDGEWAK